MWKKFTKREEKKSSTWKFTKKLFAQYIILMWKKMLWNFYIFVVKAMSWVHLVYVFISLVLSRAFCREFIIGRLSMRFKKVSERILFNVWIFSISFSFKKIRFKRIRSVLSIGKFSKVFKFILCHKLIIVNAIIFNLLHFLNLFHFV